MMRGKNETDTVTSPGTLFSLGILENLHDGTPNS